MIRRSIRALFCLLFLTLPGLALAAGSTAPGLYLRWEQCYTDGGAANQTFACNANTGVSTLILSFELAQAMANASGLEIAVDIATPDLALPAWWQFKNAGSCRQTSLSLSFGAPASSVNCVDWGAGQASGGIASYNVPFNVTPDRQRLLVAVAVPPSALASLAPGQEYVACLLPINHLKTVGTNACVGCALPACISAQLIKITHPDPALDITLTLPADGPGSERVTWQDGAFANMTYRCGQTGCRTDFTCTSVTPTHGSTWGAVKALYR